ncbi:hypothetical protein ACFL52_02060 [Candidatus Margulisiibacteriota bacterium]
MQSINQIIPAGIVFRGGRVFPRWFVWEGRKYNILEINYTWEDHEGIEKLFCFSVTDGVNSYELSFNIKRMIWKLEKLY